MLNSRVIKSIAVLIVCMVFLPSIGFAYDEDDYISDHITVQFLQDGVWIDALQGTLFIHKHGMIADGDPFRYCLTENSPPEIVAGNEPFFRVIFDQYVESIDYRVTCYEYKYSDDDLTLTLKELKTEDRNPIPFSQLEAGDYLVSISASGRPILNVNITGLG